MPPSFPLSPASFSPSLPCLLISLSPASFFPSPLPPSFPLYPASFSPSVPCLLLYLSPLPPSLPLSPASFFPSLPCLLLSPASFFRSFALMFCVSCNLVTICQRYEDFSVASTISGLDLCRTIGKICRQSPVKSTVSPPNGDDFFFSNVLHCSIY